MTTMMLKDACRWASGLILMFGAITTSAVASADHEGNAGNMRRPHSHMQNSHHYVRHNLARSSGCAAALLAADAGAFDAPHFVGVGPNG